MASRSDLSDALARAALYRVKLHETVIDEASGFTAADLDTNLDHARKAKGMVAVPYLRTRTFGRRVAEDPGTDKVGGD